MSKEFDHNYLGGLSRMKNNLIGRGMIESDEDFERILSMVSDREQRNRLVQLCGDGKLLDKLQEMFPHSDDGNPKILNFFLDKNSVNVLDRFSDPRLWDSFEIQNFLDVNTHFKFSLPATAFAKLIEISEHPVIGPWVGTNKKAVSLLNDLADISKVNRFFASENLLYIVSNFTFDEFELYCKSYKLNDLISNPEICKRIGLDNSDKSWEQRLLDLNLIFYDLGLSGYDRKQIEAIIFSEYRKGLIERISIRDKLNTDDTASLDFELNALAASRGDFAKRRLFESMVLAGAQSQPELMSEVRASVDRESRDEWSNRWKRRLETLDIAWLESKDYPLRGQLPSLGYEIEFKSSGERDAGVYCFIDRSGFKMGSGGGIDVLEFSPGPFAHHRTAGLTFLSYLDSGVLDTQKYYDQSVHLNVGLPTLFGVSAYMRWLQLTGLAYNPLYDDQAPRSIFNYGNNDKHRLRVQRNNQEQGDGDYVECKEFSLMLESDFLRFLRYSQMLGAGLLAWQRAYLEQNTDIRSLLLDGGDQAFWNMELKDHREMILKSNISAVQKDIALVYAKMINILKVGLQKNNVEGFLNTTVLNSTAKIVVEDMQNVFPNKYSRAASGAVDKKTNTAFRMGKMEFPNVIAFSRFLAQKAAFLIEKILKQEEKRMIFELENALSDKDSYAVWRVVKKYQHLIKIEGLSLEQKKEKILRLVAHYKSRE